MKVLLGLLSVVLFMSMSGQSKGWHGIVPLHSTYDDVKRELGVESCSCPISTWTLAGFYVMGWAWDPEHPDKPIWAPIPTAFSGISAGAGSAAMMVTSIQMRQSAMLQDPEVPLRSDQITAVRNGIDGLLTDKCAKFIDQLVSGATGRAYDSKKSLLTDFDSIRDSGGFFLGGTKHGGSASLAGKKSEH